LASSGFPAVADLLSGASERDAQLDLPCGHGPTVLLDGQTLQTSLHGHPAATSSS